MNKLHLYVWAGSRDLPSSDLECLYVISYIAALKQPIPIEFHPVRNPFIAGLMTEFPLLIHKNAKFHGSDAIIEYLQAQGLQLDGREFSPELIADINAYKAVILHNIRPALIHTLWEDTTFYNSVTRPKYAFNLPIPFSWVIPSMLKRKFISQLNYLNDWRLYSTNSPNLTLSAREALNRINSKLQTNSNDLKNKVNTFHCLLYTYCQYILNFSDKSSSEFPLRLHIETYTNLAQFCNIFHDNYIKRLSLFNIQLIRNPTEITTYQMPFWKDRTSMFILSLGVALIGAYGLFAIQPNFIFGSKSNNNDEIDGDLD